MEALKNMPDLRDGSPNLFDRRKTWNLILPLIAERVLLSLMGMADTLMVTRAGTAAVSSVSLVNSLNTVIVQLFAALALGGSVVITQLVGAREEHEARQCAKQLMMSVLVMSTFVSLLCILLRRPLLQLLYPKVEADVMSGALTYLLITAFSFPFVSIGTAAAAIFRAGGNSRLPMVVNVISNLLNIAGNAVLIFGFKLGVLGAAVPTLIGNIFTGILLTLMLRSRNFRLYTRRWLPIKPSWPRIRKMMRIGIPSGLENGLFDLGKLMVQTIISGVGTTALAANALVINMESLSSKAADGINAALMVIVGTCVGAARYGEARAHVKRLCTYSFVSLLIGCTAIVLLMRPVARLAGLSPEATAMAVSMCTFIHLSKPFLSVPSFALNCAMRGAGDVRFTMTVGVCSMWFCRVLVSFLLYRFAGLGALSMWWGMCSDWFVRSICNILHYQSGRWMNKAVVRKA